MKRRAILLTASETQSGYDRQKWAEGLISQLPSDHEGRNTWLMHYGVGAEAVEFRKAHDLGFGLGTMAAFEGRGAGMQNSALEDINNYAIERQDPVADNLTKTAPPRIWLQVDYSGVGDRSEPFPTDIGDISWCKDSVGGLEVEYVRADLSEDRWLDGYYEGFKEANRLAYQSPGKRWLDQEPDVAQLVEALHQAFPLLDDKGLDEDEHHCEWSIQQERKRLHAILAAHRKGEES